MGKKSIARPYQNDRLAVIASCMWRIVLSHQGTDGRQRMRAGMRHRERVSVTRAATRARIAERFIKAAVVVRFIDFGVVVSLRRGIVVIHVAGARTGAAARMRRAGRTQVLQSLLEALVRC